MLPNEAYTHHLVWTSHKKVEEMCSCNDRKKGSRDALEKVIRALEGPSYQLKETQSHPSQEHWLLPCGVLSIAWQGERSKRGCGHAWGRARRRKMSVWRQGWQHCAMEEGVHGLQMRTAHRMLWCLVSGDRAREGMSPAS